MSDLLNSQESDLFPPDVKDCIEDPAFAEVINSVQGQDPFLNEETHHYLIPQAPMPSPTCSMLCTEDYPGPYEFEVQVNGENSGKNWMFSYDLNKLFINMNTIIHISFKCNTFPSGLYVRAIPVFCESVDFQNPVERCLHHRSRANKHNDGVAEYIYDHVIRIENPQALYDYNDTSRRRSVRVLLDSPQAGSDWVTVAFKFMCKNSCLSGMNRRPIEVIFTLEDYGANVYGRQKMKVRICSCPKRDKTKEEGVLQPRDPCDIPRGKRLKRPNEEMSTQPTKQRREDEMFEVRMVPDLELYLDGLDYMHCRLTRRLRIENRAPTEKEREFLSMCEQEMQQLEPQMSGSRRNGEH